MSTTNTKLKVRFGSTLPNKPFGTTSLVMTVLIQIDDNKIRKMQDLKY